MYNCTYYIYVFGIYLSIYMNVWRRWAVRQVPIAIVAVSRMLLIRIYVNIVVCISGVLEIGQKSGRGSERMLESIDGTNSRMALHRKWVFDRWFCTKCTCCKYMEERFRHLTEIQHIKKNFAHILAGIYIFCTNVHGFSFLHIGTACKGVRQLATFMCVHKLN